VSLSQRRRGAIKGATAQVGNQINEVCGTSIEQGSFCLKCSTWKGELGLEPTIELYISHLIQIFDEVKRILKPTGTCWVNIDDSYAGGGNNRGNKSPISDKQASNRGATGQCAEHQKNIGDIGIPAKSLCLIPSRFALAMVEHGWILRNDICWFKGNPMPESVRDRFTTSWEHLFFFVKSQRYWFEQQFEPNILSGAWHEPDAKYLHKASGDGETSLRDKFNRVGSITLGRNRRDVWKINTQPYPEAHFATFPEKLCETPILAGCPSHICKKCGVARRKVYNSSGWESHQSARMAAQDTPGNPMYRGGHHNDGLPYRASLKDNGYTDCGCEPKEYEPGVLLDPFCGSGTALAVAKKLGRKAIGIELNPNYCKLAAERIRNVPVPMEL
jgi:DNA modification methylase